MKVTQPSASLSLDLDNKWSYMKTHGDAGWDAFPSYLNLVVPRVLNFLRERNLTITFFIVGQDACLEKNREAIQSIAKAGHEIGNHSFNHEPWLHLRSEKEIDTELAKAEEVIENATGRRIYGFRGPGFVHSEIILRVLARRGYFYDASTLPTFIGPVARMYYLMNARLEPEEKHARAQLFGTYKEGFRPIKPYRWRIEDKELLEIPVTTMPLIRLPLHASYLLYLSVFSESLALAYFNFALKLCKVAGIVPSLLLHPLDFLGSEDESDLSFFPAMKLGRERKLTTITQVFDRLCAQFDVITVRQHAEQANRCSPLPEIHLGFKEGAFTS